MKCLNCGNEISDGAQFCKVCGNRVEQEQTAKKQGVTCSHCGKPVPANTVYCAYCGKPIYGAPKKKNTGIIVLASVAVLVTLSCLVMLYLFMFGDLGKKEMPPEDEQAVEVVPDDKTDDKDKADKADDADGEDNDVWSPVDKSQIEDEDEDDEDYPDYEDYTPSDLHGLSKSDVGFMRNEIYARHGYIFKTEPYKSYFESQSWYHPNPNFSESSFSAEEKAMVDALIKYEKQMGWR